MRLTQGRELDAIVVELSGIADPVAVRDNWEQARLVSVIYLLGMRDYLLCLLLFFYCMMTKILLWCALPMHFHSFE